MFEFLRRLIGLFEEMLVSHIVVASQIWLTDCYYWLHRLHNLVLLNFISSLHTSITRHILSHHTSHITTLSENTEQSQPRVSSCPHM